MILSMLDIFAPKFCYLRSKYDSVHCTKKLFSEIFLMFFQSLQLPGIYAVSAVGT